MRIYNTLTRKKEELIPITPGEVKMYACGPTVYNYIHIGNARPICVFDTLRRYLEYRGYKVTFVQNFTDIDDKIIKRANEENISTNIGLMPGAWASGRLRSILRPPRPWTRSSKLSRTSLTTVMAMK